MIIRTQDISINNETLTLTNQRVMYWSREKAIIVSDLHIGKTAHFRKNGIAIPDEVLMKDLSRLETLINHFNADKVIIVGDLFHAEYNSNIDFFSVWLQQHKNIKFILIPGNHDKKILQSSYNFLIQIFQDFLEISPFRFIHEFDDNNGFFSICGHLHPGIVIQGAAKQSFRLPCYIRTNHCIYLPAFSLFTGLYTKSNFKIATYYPFGNDFIHTL